MQSAYARVEVSFDLAPNEQEVVILHATRALTLGGNLAQLLIADDDVELCKLLQQYFELDGIQLDMVHQGDVVLATLQQGNYDLLILDIMLPGMNGLDVLRQVRRTRTTPVLMLSARGEEMDRIIGLELGADDYLPKPCSPRELAARCAERKRDPRWRLKIVCL